MKKALSLLLALMMVVGLVMPQTWATGLQETEPDAAITETQPGDTAEPGRTAAPGGYPVRQFRRAYSHHPHQECRGQRRDPGKGGHAQRQRQPGGGLPFGDRPEQGCDPEGQLHRLLLRRQHRCPAQGYGQQRPAQVGDVPDHRPGRRLRDGLGYRWPRGTGHQRRLLQHADRRAHRLPHYGGQPGKTGRALLCHSEGRLRP